MKKILSVILSLILFSCVLHFNIAEASVKTLYISSVGNDTNSGDSTDAPLKTFAAAYKKANSNSEIIILDNCNFENPTMYLSALTVKGLTSSVTLTLPSEVNLRGSLKFDNLILGGVATIYANGYTFEISESVTSTERLNVYGGKKNTANGGDTNIILLGGLYQNIYGGGYNAAVNGSTNVTLGGKANAGDGISDSATNISPCFVYGGGNNGTVTGKTNVTLKGNAVAKYLVGAGTGTNGTAKDTNIFIEGGKVMNVYAGSRDVTLPAGTVTHITMTGGLAEALFGGCEGVALTGHTYISLLGGEVSRRVYTGCYNDAKEGLGFFEIKLTYQSDRYVTGTTTLSISPGAKVNTKTGLSGTNALNVGVFSGSRTANQHDAEQNTIIFLDGCYSTFKNKIGEKGGIAAKYLKSFEDFVITASTGGKVYGTNTKGIIYIAPEKDNCGVVNNGYYKDENVSVSAGTTTITFEKNFDISSISTKEKDNGIIANITFAARNACEEINPQLVVAVYDNETGEFIACQKFLPSPNETSKTFDIDCNTKSGKTYLVKAMLWNNIQKPLTEIEKITLTK